MASGGLKGRAAVGANVALSLLLASALLVMVNWLASRQWLRGDWTAGQLNSISERTEQVVRGLAAPVRVTVFLAPNDPSFDGVRELLARMDALSGRIEVEYLDPDRDRDRAKALLEKFQIYDLDAVVFECGERSKYVTADKMVDYDFDTPAGQPRFKGFKAESEFVAALLDVSEARQSQICFVTGHGERDPEGFDQEGLGNAVTEIRRANYQLRPVKLEAEHASLDGCDVILLAGPVKPLSAPVASALQNSLGAGGRLLLLLDPVAGAGGEGLGDLGLGPLLTAHGITLLKGVALDPGRATMLNPGSSFYVEDYGDAEAVRPLAQRQIPVVLSRARPLKLDPAKAPAGAQTTALMRSSEGAWAESDLTGEGEPEPGEGEARGPLLLGATIEYSPAGATRATRLAVVADSDFAANWMLGSAGNLDLVLGLVHWLADKKDQIAIAPKSPEQVRLALSARQMSTLFWIVVVVMPLCSVVLGAVVAWRRRR